MKKNYIVLLLTFLFSGVMVAQDQQKNFINYQGVARSADNALMVSEQMTITIALKFGTAAAAPTYEESHTITTDANGVFSLLIGNGSSLIGDFNSLPWGSVATFVTVSMNGNEIGTTEMMAVPYAISSGDAKQSAAEVPYDNSTSGLSASTTQEAIDELITDASVDADSDPENEIQILSFDAGTNELSLSDGNSVTIPSGGTDADADPENELQTLAFNAGTNELSLSDGNTIVIPTGGVDGDGDSTNEIQTISFDAGTNELSLSDGGTVTIPSGGTDADADSENELQNLSLTGTILNISDGMGVDLAPIIPPGGTDDQNLALVDDVLTIENGTGSVDLKDYFNRTTRHGLLVGDDGIIDGLVGTSDGQVAKWDAALGNWVAGTDETSLGGGSSTGLEALDEGSGIGWRLIGRNPAFYGTIGLSATDLSLSGTNSSTRGATGISATAMGEETTASGPRSTALGYGAQATGPVSTSIGEETMASGEFAVAMGDRTLASEQSATAFGAGTKATNPHATAMGESTTASGKSATAMGVVTKAESLASLAVGRNNIGGGDPFVWQPNDPLFEVGNGSETIPSNALTVLKNGMIGVGTDAPAAMLQVEGNIRSSDLSGTGQRNVMADANGNLVIGAGGGGSSLWSENGPDIYYNNRNVGIGTTNPNGRLHISKDSGGVPFLVLEASTGNEIHMRYGKAGVNPSWNQIAEIGDNEASSTMNHSFYDGGTLHPVMTLRGNRRMGVNNPNPQSTFDVQGNIRSSNLDGGGNVIADVNGNLTIGADGGGSSLWTPVGDDINFSGGNVQIGATLPGYISEASKFLSISGGANDGSLGAIEIRGRQQTSNKPIGRFNFLSLDGGGSMYEIARVEARISDGAQYRGDLAFYTMDGSVGADASLQEQMTIKRTGNIGIGTIEPTARLDIDGDIRSRDLSGAGQRNVMADSEGNLVIAAGGGGNSLWTEDLNGVNYSSGSVGIGTMSSQLYPLSVSSDSERSINLTSTNNDNYIAFNNASGYKGYAGIFNGDADMDFGTGFLNGTGKVNLVTNTIPRLTVAANGNVGIGNTNPDEEFVVGDNMNNGWSLPAITVGDEIGGGFFVGNPEINFKIDAGSTFGITRFRVNDANGNGQGLIEMRTRQLNVGRAPGVNTTRTYPLRVVQNIVGEGGQYGINLVNGNNPTINWELFAEDTGHFTMFYDGALRGRFDSATGAYSQTSDGRLKTNIKASSAMLSKLMQLQPKRYNYKTNKSKTYNGFIAQDLQEIFPDVVDEVKGKNGSVSTLVVDYSQLISVTVTAVQEQQLLISDQTQKIFDLEERLKILEAKLEN